MDPVPLKDLNSALLIWKANLRVRLNSTGFFPSFEFDRTSLRRREKASTTSLDATTSSSNNCSRDRKPSGTDEPHQNERLHEESSKLPENNSTNKRINEYKRRVELRRKKSEEEKLNPVTQRNNEINEVMNRKAGTRLTAAAEKDMEDDVQSVRKAFFSFLGKCSLNNLFLYKKDTIRRI